MLQLHQCPLGKGQNLLAFTAQSMSRVKGYVPLKHFVFLFPFSKFSVNLHCASRRVTEEISNEQIAWLEWFRSLAAVHSGNTLLLVPESEERTRSRKKTREEIWKKETIKVKFFVATKDIESWIMDSFLA